MYHRNWFHYDLQVYMELQVLSKTASHLWFYAYEKYKKGKSTQRHIWWPICYGGYFSKGISGKLPKNSNFKCHFLTMADRIDSNFCMTIKKIKPNDIFQNCVHSTSTLTETKLQGKLWKCCDTAKKKKLNFNLYDGQGKIKNIVYSKWS